MKKNLMICVILLMIFSQCCCSGEQNVENKKHNNIPVSKDNMVFIKGGAYEMGSPETERDRSADEGPVHKVQLDSFYMCKYEVTQREWKSIMGNHQSYNTGEDFPADKVSWYDAVEFCNKKSVRDGLKPCYTINGENVTCDWSANGYRLPTEAEWEYACRAGTTTIFHYGNALDGTMANMHGRHPYGIFLKSEFDGIFRQKTTPVGQFKPNAWGLYDMHGNVWEWCWDWYEKSYYTMSPLKNPTGPATGVTEVYDDDNSNPVKCPFRVFRGGCWRSFGWDCRSASRPPFTAIPFSSLFGFRYVRNAGQ